MINLQLSRKLFNDKFYPLLTDYSKRWEVYCGSAGSGKSVFISQKIIYRCLNEQIRILACRRYGTTIRQTIFEQLKQTLKDWKIYSFMKINEADYRIKFPNGSEIICTGLDDEEKLLSLTNISVIWVEEAYECSQDIVEQLNLRMRGAENGQIVLSFNPISSHSWLYEFVKNPPESFVFHHSTYADNKFLSKEYVDSLEELKLRNPQKARIYCYGEWGVDTDGLVLKNWKVEDFDTNEVAKTTEHRAGCDFGYNDPSSIVSSFYDAKNHLIYVDDAFYKTGQTLDELYNAIASMHLTKVKLQCDSAEPRTIDFLRRKGAYAVPCIKGADSVNARIAFLQNNMIIIHPRCKDVINEFENFSYEKDRRTGKFTDKMTHEFSHSIDALGYSYSDIYTKSKLKTLDKSILGL